jgi:hypothetical protein
MQSLVCHSKQSMKIIKMSLAQSHHMSVTSLWRGNFMLNWAINRPVTGETFNHRFWPLDRGHIDITNTAYIGFLLYTQNGMRHYLLLTKKDWMARLGHAAELLRLWSCTVNCKTSFNSYINTLHQLIKRNRGSSDETETRLRNGRSRNLDSIPRRDKRFCLCQGVHTGSVAHLTSGYQEHEADVKNAWIYTSTLSFVFML